jgi:hypothetical protein
MMRTTALLLALAASAPVTASAQELLKPAARQGFYIGGGLRQALLTSSDDDIGNLGLFLGGGFTLRFGQVVNDKLGIGLAINNAGGSNDEWAGGFAALSLEMQLTPLPGEDFAIRGSIGVGGGGVTRAEGEERDNDPPGAFGAVYTLGVSYELFPWYEPDKYETGGFAFTGFLEGILFPGGDLVTGGVMLGLEVTYWFGFQKSRLDLPPDAAFVED